MIHAGNAILNQAQVQQKVQRIAYEIYEAHFGEPNIVLAGVHPMGYRFASMLMAAIREISQIEVTLVRVTVDKFAEKQSEVQLDAPETLMHHKPVILVDDVLNTGRTTAYSLQPFLQMPIKSLEVAVLVDRSHHSFPIHPNYVGYELSTTINQHIAVDLSDGPSFGVYLY